MTEGVEAIPDPELLAGFVEAYAKEHDRLLALYHSVDRLYKHDPTKLQPAELQVEVKLGDFSFAISPELLPFEDTHQLLAVASGHASDALAAVADTLAETLAELAAMARTIAQASWEAAGLHVGAGDGDGPQT